jgi:poly(3-hydroxybutyrate) depolymerase
MSPRRSGLVSSWFKAARKTMRTSQRLGSAAGKATARHAPAMRQAVQHLLSGVATPAPVPASRGSGRWEEGRWGLGPMAMRRYRLFLPTGTSRALPLVVLLHGCGQDAASFAATTRAATAARAGGYAVLLPEQSSEANPQRCWNWFRGDTVTGAEAAVLHAIIERVCQLHRLRRDRVFALGLSAGGTMAVTLALRYPELFGAVATHSGAVAHSAASALQAGQAMRGRRAPELAALHRRLAGRRLPPLMVMHGDADRSVAPANAEAAAALWLGLTAGTAARATARNAQRGTRYPYTVTDWKLERRVYVRLIRVAHLGHAWSGGAARQAYADPQGPDALRLAWRFFTQCVG